MNSLNTKSKIEAIKKKNVVITVVGLGKMGLPIAMSFTHQGYTVKGLEISKELVKKLNDGETDLTSEPGVSKRLKSAVDKQLFTATTDTKVAVNGSDFIIFIIPVLHDQSGKQKISSLLDTYKQVSQYSKDGVIYIQESTLAPGTTSNEIRPVLEKNGKISGKDFGLVFAPERTFSGRALQDIEENYPKLIGGDTVNAAEITGELYKQVSKKGVIILSDATTAEAVKTFKGTYRFANIAIANELAILADLYGVDIMEVIEAANTEPYSHIHTPGIGVGGHCIPVYPQFIIAGGRERGYEPELFVKSDYSNLYMVDYAIKQLQKYSETKITRVLIMGLAYRGGVKELRNSPTLRLVPKLREKGIEVKVSDPLYSESELDNLFGKEVGKKWELQLLSNYNHIIIVTDHEEFTNIETHLNNNVIYDGRYVINHEKVQDQSVIIQPGRLNLIK